MHWTRISDRLRFCATHVMSGVVKLSVVPQCITPSGLGQGLGRTILSTSFFLQHLITTAANFHSSLAPSQVKAIFLALTSHRLWGPVSQPYSDSVNVKNLTESCHTIRVLQPVIHTYKPPIRQASNLRPTSFVMYTGLSRLLISLPHKRITCKHASGCIF